MARQARSEATRRKILDAAVDVFGDVGYAAAGMSDIVQRSGLTKGAFYYHFDRKESVASAIMEQTSARLLRGYSESQRRGAAALVNTIDGLVAIAAIVAVDPVCRTGVHLIRVLGDFDEVATGIHDRWLEQIDGQLRLARDEGELRSDIEVSVVAKLVLWTMLGAVGTSSAADSNEEERVRQTCEILLSAVVSEDSLPYYQEFLARRSELFDAASDRNIPIVH